MLVVWTSGNEDVGDKRVVEIADEFEKDSSQTVLKIRGMFSLLIVDLSSCLCVSLCVSVCLCVSLCVSVCLWFLESRRMFDLYSAFN